MWTTEQKKVIDARNRNLLVSAAAGAGKTAVLVERIIQMILNMDHPVDIDKLLIVTFTKAAASEMRERIGNAIEKEVLVNPDNKHLQRQLALIHKAQITTIHSFCLDVIKGHYNDIDLDPAFKVADENELVLIQTELVQDILEEKYSEADEAFLDFVESYTTGKSDTPLEELILKLYRFAISYPEPEKWLQDCLEFYRVQNKDELSKTPHMKFALPYIKTILRESLEELKKALDISNEEQCAYSVTLANDMDALEEISEIEDYDQLCRVLNSYSFATLSRKKDNVEKETKEFIKSIRDQVKKSVQSLNKDLLIQNSDEMLEDIQKMLPSVRVIVDLTVEFIQRFTATKRERNLVDFGDLEHLALQILTRKDESTGELIPSRVAEELREWYHEIIIDEYQDSNIIQDTILYSVSKEPIGQPNIFMVGDVKQSIYKFRLARPELFIGKYNQYTRSDSDYQCIELHKNFRSRAEVLDVTNYIFKQIMREELGDITYDDDVALNLGASFPEERKSNRKVDLIIVEKSKQILDPEGEDDTSDKGTLDDEEELSSKELEARAIAYKIREMVDGEQVQQVYDKKLGDYRPVRYSDIVILLRSLQGWTETFIDTLTDEGIPAYADTAAGYFATVEIRTILSLLMLVDNPRQDIPLAALLRSPIVDLSEEDMAAIRLANRSSRFYDALEKYLESEKDTESYKKVKDFYKQLLDFREKASYLSIHELIYYVLDKTGYYDYASAMPAGTQRKANIDMLIARAIAFENNGFKGLFKFIKYIEKIKKYEIDFGEASTITEKDNTVRIMSIHKSKGLEFPVVIVASMGKMFNNRDSYDKTILHPDLGIGIDYIDGKRRLRSQTFYKKVISKKLTLENLGEELRVLYVALTRAKEKLILTGYVSSVEKLLKKLVHSLMESRESLPFRSLSGAKTYYDWVIAACMRNKGFQGILEAYDITVVNESPCLVEDVPFDVQIVNEDNLTLTAATKAIDDHLEREILSNWNPNLVYDQSTKDAIEELLNWEYDYEKEIQTSIKVTVSELKRLGEDPDLSDELIPKDGKFAESAGKEIEPIKQFERIHSIEKSMIGKGEDSDLAETGFIGVVKEGSDIRTYRSVDHSKILPRFRQKTEVIANTRYGTIIHKLFEKIPVETMNNREQVLLQIAELSRAGFFTEEEAKKVHPEIFTTFYTTTLAQKMMDAAKEGHLYKERPFVLGIPAKEVFVQSSSEELMMVQGVIDAYLELDDGLVIVDYKTDRASKQEIIERYGVQLSYYKRALEQITGKLVKETVIYSTFLKEEIIL